MWEDVEGPISFTVSAGFELTTQRLPEVVSPRA